MSKTKQKENIKKDKFSWKESYELMSQSHTFKMLELRESNMAFDELLSRMPTEKIREAFYELKELKISKSMEKFNKNEAPKT